MPPARPSPPSKPRLHNYTMKTHPDHAQNSNSMKNPPEIEIALNFVDAINGVRSDFTDAQMAGARAAFAVLDKDSQELLLANPDTESLEPFADGISISDVLDWQDIILGKFVVELQKRGLITNDQL